jgi:hypothetical protein
MIKFRNFFENKKLQLSHCTNSGRTSSISDDNSIWSIPANLLIVKLDSSFGFVESRTVSAETGNTEGYVTGLRSDSKYFYVTYNHVKLGTEKATIYVFNKQ